MVFTYYWPQWKTCSICGGNGINNGWTCTTCGGAGVVLNHQPRPTYPPCPPYRPPATGPKWVPQCKCSTQNAPGDVCPVHPGFKI